MLSDYQQGHMSLLSVLGSTISSIPEEAHDNVLSILSNPKASNERTLSSMLDEVLAIIDDINQETFLSSETNTTTTHFRRVPPMCSKLETPNGKPRQRKENATSRTDIKQPNALAA